jgi:beta-1,4-mannosyltransferase
MRRVLPWPAYRTNPYVRRLSAELRGRGVAVSRVPWLRAGASLLAPGDWVHLHWPGAALVDARRAVYERRIAALAGLLARFRRRGLRIAWTAHNLLPHDDPHPDLGRAARRVVLEAVDHVFAHFDAAAAALADELGHRGPVSVTPHGHYIDDYAAPPPAAAARARLGLPLTGRVFLVFGQLRPYKNLGAIAGGFLAATRPDDRLVICGAAEGAVRPPADPRLRVREARVPDALVPVLFAAADAMLLAHRAFFTSGSAVLALSMGCPVLGPPLHHLATLGGPPRVWPLEATADGVAAAVERFVPVAPAERAAIRDWARAHLSWAEAGRVTAEVLLGA